MGRRYTFFRDATGRPYRGSDGKCAPVTILAEIGNRAKQGADGGVYWQGFLIDRMYVTLRSALVIVDDTGKELNEYDSWVIHNRVVTELVKKAPGAPVKASELLSRSDELAASFFRQPVVKYELVTSLSIASLPAKCITIRDCTVSSLASRQKYPLPKTLLGTSTRPAFIKHVTSSAYTTIRVATAGRSASDATDNALGAINLLRAYWSLFATYGSWSISFGSTERTPVGVIHTGPIHTLHYHGGELVNNGYWCELDYSEDRRLFDRNEKWGVIDKHRRKAAGQVARLPHRGEVEELLIRYANALDHPNPDLALLQMWGILERLTNTVGAKYDDTIDRATWIFGPEQRALAKEELDVLRHRRNRFVHAGKSVDETDQVARLIKSFVDPHLLHLIRNPLKIASIEEYAEFLSLPVDPTLLERRRSKIKRALHFLRPPPQRGRSGTGTSANRSH